MKKRFDAVAMKRRAAEEIYKQIAGMTVEQQLAFWEERTRALQKRQAARSKRRAARPSDLGATLTSR